MRGTYSIRRARREYECTEGSFCHLIKPGELYLRGDCPPEHEFNRTRRPRKWEYIKACLKCAERMQLHTSETRKQLEEANGNAGAV